MRARGTEATAGSWPELASARNGSELWQARGSFYFTKALEVPAEATNYRLPVTLELVLKTTVCTPTHTHSIFINDAMGGRGIV